MRKKITPWLMSALIVLGLSGCGNSSSQQEASTGIYKDAGVVAGLTYKTPTQSGITDEKGTFRYMPGETVTFSVSNIAIGQATGADSISTFDLVGIAAPLSSLGIPENNPVSNKFQEATNISLFLQTLDEDSNPSNGINIPVAVNTVAANTPINFKLTRKSTYDFNESPQFKVFIGSCRSAGIWGGIKVIQQPGIAANKLYQGLGLSPSVYAITRNTYSNGSYTAVEYASNGLRTKDSNYDANGNLFFSVSSTYNIYGYLTQKNHTYLLAPSNDNRDDYAYDANGNLTQKVSTSNGGATVIETRNQFDINGNPTQSTRYANGAQTGYTSYFFNPNGTLAREEIYNNTNVLQSSSSYTYDNNLNLIRSDTSSLTAPSTSLVYEYAQNQYLTQFTEYTAGALSTVTTATYDNEWNLTGYITRDATGAQTSRYAATSNSLGYILTQEFFGSSDTLLSSYVLTYDANGSLTKEVVTSFNLTDTTTFTSTNLGTWGSLLYSIMFFGGSG